MATLKDYVTALASGIIKADIGGTGETGSPTFIQLYDTSGADWFLFVETDGTVKVHTAKPTADADGSVIGSQS